MDNLRQTPLHLACKYGSDRVFRAIIESEKLRLEHIYNEAFDFSILHSLCRSRLQRCDMVESFIKKLIQLKLVRIFQKNTQYYQNLASSQKFVDTLLVIIIDHFRLRKGQNEIHSNQKDILKKAEQSRIVDEIGSFLKDIVNKKDGMGKRPLQLAVEQNYLDLVDLLFKYGALSILHDSSHTLPIHIAAKIGSIEMFTLLKKHNSISFKPDYNMNNLFHIAVENNKIEFLKVACDYLASQIKDFRYVFEAVNASYLTPLFLAVSKSNVECVKILIEVNSLSKFYVDDFQRNIFHVCSMFDSMDVFKYLIGLIERNFVDPETFYECANAEGTSQAWVNAH